MKAARLYIYSGVASLLIRPVIGRVNDVSWINPYYTDTVAAGLEGVVTLLMPMATTSFHFAMFFVVFGLSDGTLGSGLSIAVLNSLPERLRPLGIGLYNCLACFASACGAALGGIKFYLCLVTAGAFFWDYSGYFYSGLGITKYTEFQFPKESSFILKTEYSWRR